MHRHAIDWLRQVHLTPDAALAERRWQVAERMAKNPPRSRILGILRLFLFPRPPGGFEKQFTEELVTEDPEFPVNGNLQELRLMAGFIMASLFQKPSYYADAVALGIRAANFQTSRVEMVVPEIAADAEEYLRKEAARLRPDKCSDDAEGVEEVLTERLKAVTESMAGADAAKQQAAKDAFRACVAKSIASLQTTFSARTEQLAEEVGLLWWVFGEFSTELGKSVSELTADEYALVAGAEAADRTRILPPPPCIGPLLKKALKGCRPGKDGVVLANYIEGGSAAWRAAFLRTVALSDCRDLAPICGALEKFDELGDVVSVCKALQKLCPGISFEVEVRPFEAADQFFREIVFLRALAGVTEN